MRRPASASWRWRRNSTSWSRTSGPASWARLGLSYEAFTERNPAIIFVSSSGYGQIGPYATRPGQDMLIQALTGMLFLAGRAGEPPTASGIGIADQYTALHIAIGILAALEHRRHTGQGQRVELNLFSCTISAQQQELTYYLNHGASRSGRSRTHGSIWATAPFGIYPTAGRRHRHRHGRRARSWAGPWTCRSWRSTTPTR